MKKLLKIVSVLALVASANVRAEQTDDANTCVVADQSSRGIQQEAAQEAKGQVGEQSTEGKAF